MLGSLRAQVASMLNAEGDAQIGDRSDRQRNGVLRKKGEQCEPLAVMWCGIDRSAANRDANDDVHFGHLIVVGKGNGERTRDEPNQCEHHAKR